MGGWESGYCTADSEDGGNLILVHVASAASYFLYLTSLDILATDAMFVCLFLFCETALFVCFCFVRQLTLTYIG